MDRSRFVAILGAAAALAVVVCALLVVTRRRAAPPATPALSAEQRAYLGEIAVTGARMSAAQNLVGDTVTYLDAQVGNRGGRVVRGLEIQMEFHDTLNQVVLREKARPVRPRAPPLNPGENRAFQVTFEHMPADWNHAAPTITTTVVDF